MTSTSRVVALAVLLPACIDYEPKPLEEPERGPSDASISGRLCDADGRSWLADAQVYTNIYDERGKLIDTRTSYSDRDGNFVLSDLPADTYLVYVAHGTDVRLLDTVVVDAGEEVVLEQPSCFDPSSLDVAVVEGDYDEMAVVLDDLGFSDFTIVDGKDPQALTDFLSDPANLAPYDIVFLNGGTVEQGIFYDVGPDTGVPDQIAENLRQYVAAGGSLYASDWAYDAVERAWPDAIDFLGDDARPNAAELGEYDLVGAMVQDESLAGFLGSTSVAIEYDLPVWPPMESVQPYVSIHLAGKVQYREGEEIYTIAGVPLLASFAGGQGRVVFSTFRVAANQSPEMSRTFQYMMYDIEK